MMTFKKWQKPPKKGEKMKNVENEVQNVVKNVEEEITTPVVEEETPVTTVAEEEITTPKHVKVKDRLLGEVGGSKITKSKGWIRFEAQVWAYPMFLVPAEIRNYLVKRWFTTNVYKKDKEWLEKHNVDMEIVEKLKQFLSEKL